jgi:plastocyanin
MRAPRSGGPVLVGTLALAMLAAACGKTAAANGSGGSPTPSPTPATSPSPTPSSSPGSVYTTKVDEGPNDTFTFAPTTVTVKQGQQLTLDNVSNTPHTFTVTGKDIDVQTSPGSTGQVTIDLPPGTYPFICRFHQALGMKGTLVVR